MKRRGPVPMTVDEFREEVREEIFQAMPARYPDAWVRADEAADRIIAKLGQSFEHYLAGRPFVGMEP